MKITLNGEEREFGSELTIGELLTELGLQSNRVVIELNREILNLAEALPRQLKSADKLEIIQFVGGG